MRSLLVAPLLARVREAGHDPATIVRHFGLGPRAETDAGLVTSLATLGAIFEVAAEMLGDPFVGLHLGEALARGTFGIVEFACEAAPTVRAALERLSRYHALLNDLVVLTVREDDSAIVVEHDVPGSPSGAGRHPNEFFVANVLVQARRVTGRPFFPIATRFAHDRRGDTSEIRRIVGPGDLRFAAGKNAIVLDAGDASAPIRTADAPLGRVLEGHAEELLGARPKPERFLDQVRAEVGGRLAGRPPSLDTVARALRLSPRTLQRRLNEEATSLSALVESVRQERARALVRDPGRTAESLARELGYGDARAFLRAFRRWTGTTPSRFRVD
jgi:AraC-like DNA-binding protein